MLPRNTFSSFRKRYLHLVYINPFLPSGKRFLRLEVVFLVQKKKFCLEKKLIKMYVILYTPLPIALTSSFPPSLLPFASHVYVLKVFQPLFISKPFQPLFLSYDCWNGMRKIAVIRVSIAYN